MGEIEVRISQGDMLKIHPGTHESYLISCLKEKGVPIKGVLLFGGVGRGVLTRQDDPETLETVFKWKE